jgi:cation diffusion facilitator family transporter
VDKHPDLKKEQRITTKKVIITSVAVDIIDVILNFSIAVLSGSVVMMTQVLEGVSDLASSGLLLIGFNRSLQKEDRNHPFGYGTEIYFWSFLSAVIMFGLTSTISFYFGWQRFFHPQPIKAIYVTVIILILTLFTNGYAFFISLRRLLRERPLKHILRIFYRSSLIETKTVFILDLMGTMASMLGSISLGIYILTGDMRFDGLGAMIIGIVLAVFSLFLVMGIRELLIGKRAPAQTEEKIRQAALEVEEVEDVLGIKTLHIGTEKLLVDLDVHMQSKLGTRELERLMDKIKDKIRKKVPSAKYIQVELETPRIK